MRKSESEPFRDRVSSKTNSSKSPKGLPTLHLLVSNGGWKPAARLFSLQLLRRDFSVDLRVSLRPTGSCGRAHTPSLAPLGCSGSRTGRREADSPSTGVWCRPGPWTAADSGCSKTQSGWFGSPAAPSWCLLSQSWFLAPWRKNKKFPESRKSNYKQIMSPFVVTFSLFSPDGS